MDKSSIKFSSFINFITIYLFNFISDCYCSTLIDAIKILDPIQLWGCKKVLRQAGARLGTTKTVARPHQVEVCKYIRDQKKDHQSILAQYCLYCDSKVFVITYRVLGSKGVTINRAEVLMKCGFFHWINLLFSSLSFIVDHIYGWAWLSFNG